MALPVGLTARPAPDSTLHDQDRDPVSLADSRGERAVDAARREALADIGAA